MKTAISCYQTIFEISSLKEGKNYKYLGIPEAEDINTKKMKKKKSNVNGLGAPEKFLSQNSTVEISSKL